MKPHSCSHCRRRIGHHPEDGKVVNAGLGRFGPYVVHAKKYGNFDKKTHKYETNDGRTVTVLDVDMDAASGDAG